MIEISLYRARIGTFCGGRSYKVLARGGSKMKLSFIGTFTLLLLILSGDVEQNPGPRGNKDESETTSTGVPGEETAIELKKMELEIKKMELLEKEKQREHELKLKEMDKQQREHELEIDKQTKENQQRFELEMKRLETENIVAAKSSRESVLENKRSNINLPKLEINKFDGSALKFQEFWDAFESSIHQNNSIEVIDKFSLMKSLLIGEAASAISGISITNANYQVAIDIILKRFGRKQIVVFAHIEHFLNIAAPTSDTKSLRTFFDECEKCIRTLEALGVNLDEFKLVFMVNILMKLPDSVRIELNLKNGMDDWQLDVLRKLLEEGIVAREFRKDTTLSESNKPVTRTVIRKSTTEALLSSNIGKPKPSRLCFYCKESHFSDECQKFYTISDRKKKLAGRCFMCFSREHSLSECPKPFPCYYCKDKENHHRSLCPLKFPFDVQQERPQLTINRQMVDNQELAYVPNCQRNIKILMAIARSKLKNKPNGTCSCDVNIIFDSGSQRSYVTEKIAKALNLKRHCYESVAIASFGSSQIDKRRIPVVNGHLQLSDGSSADLSLSVVPTIVNRFTKVGIDIKKYPGLQNLNFAYPLVNEDIPIQVDILIGNDYYYSLVCPQYISIDDNSVVLSTKLGWIPTGKFTTDEHESELCQEPTLLINDTRRYYVDSSQQLENFWNLESIGVKEDGQISDDDNAIQQFNETVKFVDGRYEVTWPWTDKKANLPENFNLAHKRLQSLMRRLYRDPENLSKYDKTIKDQEEKGVIEEVDRQKKDGDKLHYLPHHCVIKPDSNTTKLRVVYDASAKSSSNNVSLNECLLRGPVILSDLCGLLLRFRLHKVAIMSDIEKAFLQVGLQKQERDVTRFLWLKNLSAGFHEKNIKIYRFTRVIFGIISSPFLLSATVKHHLLQDTCYSECAQNIAENIYVDNVFSGESNVEKAFEFYKRAKTIFNKASMNLREWCSNSEKLMELLPTQDRVSDETVKLLGLRWNLKQDTLTVKQNSIKNEETNTKRFVLKRVSEVFDPLGFFSPITVRAKSLIQKLWKERVAWDTALSEDDLAKWMDILSDIELIDTISIPRYVNIIEADEIELHCFCDASASAYAACIYLFCKNGKDVAVNLIFCKTRLCPIKSLTLPRLELMGMLIGTRCLRFVEEELKIGICKKTLWTDSKCTLHWLKGKRIQPVFIENRLKEIRKLENTAFRYVPGTLNPADIPSRGVSLRELKDSNSWWHGPSFLCCDRDTWPQDVTFIEKESGLPLNDKEKTNEERQDAQLVTVHVSKRGYPFEIQPEAYSNLKKLVRITAWCLRFIQRIKKSSESGNTVYLTVDELKKAKVLWIRAVQDEAFHKLNNRPQDSRLVNLFRQLNVCKDSDGILRCAGRIQNIVEVDLDYVPPILLPKDHSFTKLVIEECHQLTFHQGVKHTLSTLREKYWLPEGRNQVKKVLKRCLICRKWEGGSYKIPETAPLPSIRLTQAPPFTYTGVDYFGPLYIKRNNQTEKCHICLFTCAVVRAIHLEVVEDCTAEQFLLALKRFVARRGRPKVLVSDNAKYFVLSKKVLDRMWSKIVNSSKVQSYTNGQEIKWLFNVERAPWWGGFFERMVGIVKRSLRKALNKSCLTFVELSTILCEIEHVLNSRPLTYMYAELDEGKCLTPNCFLLENTTTESLELSSANLNSKIGNEGKLSSLISKLKHREHVTKIFWKCWRKEYLTNLTESKRTVNHRGTQLFEIKVGDVVIVKEEGLPRGTWRMGRVEQIFYGRDGMVRSAKVKLTNGKEVGRSVQCLFPVEIGERETI